MYIEENINAVKNTILEEAEGIHNGTLLADTELQDLSSETSFIRYQAGLITEEIGPNFLDEDDILNFVIEVYDNPEVLKEGNLTYYEVKNEDIYQINYIYEFEFGDYLIISTKIQSLQNVELVLNNINTSQSIAMLITIVILSLLISTSISRPLKKINTYAKDISNLDFETELDIKRNDEFRDLTSSLNEMTFNLKQSYTQLNEANSKLSKDIDFEKKQEAKKKQLIYTINHELKTPLSVMKGMIEGMIDGIGRYKDKDKYLSELLGQISKVESIAKDLTYSLRLEDKAKPNDFVNTEYITNNFDSLEEYAIQKQIKINKDIIIKNLLINEELLLILITNLVKNAITYSEGKSISINTEIKDDNYTLIVRNKGHIENKDLDKIFDSFYRSDYLNIDQDGSGLGLSIVRQICELYSYEYKIFNDNNDVVAKVKIKIKN
jgi:two-component system sensor histidine kinase VanS